MAPVPVLALLTIYLPSPLVLPAVVWSKAFLGDRRRTQPHFVVAWAGLRRHQNTWKNF